MRLTRLTVLLMALITSAGFYMLYIHLTEDLESQTFQATEEALIDTAYILAGLIESEIKDGSIDHQSLQLALTLAHKRKFIAKVHHLIKTKVGTQVYLTDHHGIVTYDSSNNGRLGKDLSRYNNVYLALRDKHGARSSRVDENDPNSSALHIGVPIKQNGKVLATLTVYKPQKDVRPFISSRRNWISLSVTMIATGIIVFTISVFTWIFRPIGKLTQYAHAIARGERPNMPNLGQGREVNTLGKALKNMREALDGRSYIENYTQILTHELKSPLAAIRGSAELLTEEMPLQQRNQFIRNIHHETIRSQRIIDGLLKLAQLEAQPHLLLKEEIHLHQICQQLKHEHSQRLAPRSLNLVINIPQNVILHGDSNLLKPALANLLENAIHFSPDNGEIELKATQKQDSTEITLKDQGSGIPEYALDRVFERFYSIAKPHSKQKSSGLGLTFVKEIITLHQGSISIQNNHDTGVTVKITF